MYDKLHKIISAIDADYTDLRYEIKRNTNVSYLGSELGQIGTNSTDGFVLRVLKGGGLASVVFTREQDASRAARIAEENAVLIGRNLDQPIQLAPVEPIKDVVIPPLGEDPRSISIEEKREIVSHYVDVILKNKQIQTVALDYEEVGREKYFINSEGTEIREDLMTTRLVGEIVSKDGALVQNVRIGAGGSDGFGRIRNRDAYIEGRTIMAIDLLKAKPVTGGTYNCILNPNLTGVFTHEAFGHNSEADIVEKMPAFREKMKIGDKLGVETVTITDDPTTPGQLGHYTYDDEGVQVRPIRLMTEGVLTGRLHSRRTAASMNEPISGHCVAEDYRYPPIVRMGTIYMEPGDVGFDEMVGRLGDGLYILDAKGGSAAGENFTFGAHCGYIVKNGRLGEMVRDLNISGNLYKTLLNIAAVGDTVVLSERGGCGKGQINIRSCSGGPHVLINDLIVGGA